MELFKCLVSVLRGNLSVHACMYLQIEYFSILNYEFINSKQLLLQLQIWVVNNYDHVIVGLYM